MQMKDDLLETREESHDVLSNKGERESCGERIEKYLFKGREVTLSCIYRSTCFFEI